MSIYFSLIAFLLKFNYKIWIILINIQNLNQQFIILSKFFTLDSSLCQQNNIYNIGSLVFTDASTQTVFSQYNESDLTPDIVQDDNMNNISPTEAAESLLHGVTLLSRSENFSFRFKNVFLSIKHEFLCFFNLFLYFWFKNMIFIEMFFKFLIFLLSF